MSIVKHIKTWSLIVAVLFTTNLIAQGQGKGHHKGMALDRLKETVELTTDQEAQIEAIIEKYTKEIEAIRADQNIERTEKRSAIRELMKVQKTEIGTVLTEEQKAALKEARVSRKAEMKERFKDVDREGLKSELKAYHQENMRPTLLAQRQKLDNDISEEDQARIAELREELDGIEKTF